MVSAGAAWNGRLPRAFHTASAAVPHAGASRRIVPLPVPVLTGTVQAVPLPVGVPIVAPVTVEARENEAAVTPVTGLLNVTAKLTLAALVGSASARLMDVMVGAIS